MTAQEIADYLATEAEKDSEGGAWGPSVKVFRTTPSILFTRHFIGLKVGDQEFLITVEEVK